jgi:hypothetical protein
MVCGICCEDGRPSSGECTTCRRSPQNLDPPFQVLCASLIDWMNSLDKGFTAKIVEIAVQSTAMYAKFFMVKTGLEYN